MMLRIAVCDDMTDFLQVAKRYLEEWSDSPARLVVELFSDGESLIERHQAVPFDMIFWMSLCQCKAALKPLRRFAGTTSRRRLFC